jgi:hypothetical protein
MKILFLHGWNSVPGGVKPTYLSGNGFQVINPKLDDHDFDTAVQTAQREFDLHQPGCVVGSSRGGAVAMNIQSGDTPLMLMCPAWKSWGAVKILKPNSIILHSRNDEVVPFENSEELIDKSQLEPDQLIEVGVDHRLADDDSLSAMLWCCQQLVQQTVTNAATSESTLHNDLDQSVDDASYICESCGEEIVIPIDVTQGSDQSYVEDCPVCCNASLIHVSIDHEGTVQVWAEAEQDRD